MRPIRDKKYQASHHNFPCVFCGIKDDTIVGHHIIVRGTSGMGTKPSDALSVPSCYECHNDCHTGRITSKQQLNAWLGYALERLTVEHGQSEAVKRLAMAYWSVL